MAFALTGKGYWDSTIKICEAAISMLTACENQDIYLVDAAIEPLQNLVRHGRTLETLKRYRPSHTLPTKKSRWSNRPIQLSPHCTIQDETTVDVSLPDHTHITAKTITTEDQLKAIIPVIKRAGRFSIDCEFLALKKSQPRLKVLQIAVSEAEGYAIMIDHFQDIRIIRDVLGDVLADDSILRLGWAVRADAQAIENTVPDIKLGPILDLQSLVFEDAVETMNLANAMTKYASSWEGLNEFKYAKDMGNSFSFTDGDCIWLQQPLPPQALVYAVFDVVSLFALYRQLDHLKVKDECYWPNNVISKLSGKALQKWYLNRTYIPESSRVLISDEDVISMSDSLSSLSPVTNNFGGKSRMKARYDTDSSPLSSSSPTTNDSTNVDDDPAYLEDLERAKWLSIQDQMHQNSLYFSGGLSSASTSASAYSGGTPETARNGTLLDHNPNQHQRNVIDDEEYTFDNFDNISVESANITNENEGIKFADDVYEPSRKLDHQTLPPDTWGDVDTNRLTPNDSWQAAAGTSTSPPALDRPSTPAPASGSSPSPAPSKWNQTWGASYSDRNTGSMINAIPTNDEAGWRLFVEQSQNSWQQGVDSSMQDYDMKVKDVAGSQTNNYNNTTNNNGHTSAMKNHPATVSPSQPRRFNTMVGPTAFNQWSGGDDWETTDKPPDTMTMALPGFKARKTFGPRVVNMYDSDGDLLDDDDDDDTEDDDGDGGDGRKDGGGTGNTGTTSTASNGTNGTHVAGPSSPSAAEDMNTFREYYYMDDGRNIALHAVCRPEHVNSLVKPWDGEQQPLTISIVVQCQTLITRVKEVIPKGLSIYTSNGHAYSIALDRICSWSNRTSLIHSNLGKLLTDPHVRRISWRYPFFKKTLNARLGFDVGDVVDISDYLPPDEQKWPMTAILDKYIGDWPGLNQYKEARSDVENKEKASARKFNGSIWDRETLADATLIFSASQGAMLHTLDQVWN
ncbi:hypothetical protein BCR42DRAFT_404275 [Absidia repens]|uniref:3'-5' exonuclease domain-containing protein n=1 Tax=Absidia repens TaxID=90262 RepID=A0A1X2IVX2_9FUNG|nr:hypothetical protein BCR42DRAFT_404275 [Absidia repens]